MSSGRGVAVSSGRGVALSSGCGVAVSSAFWINNSQNFVFLPTASHYVIQKSPPPRSKNRVSLIVL